MEDEKLEKLVKTLEAKNAKRGKGGGLGIGSEARAYNFSTNEDGSRNDVFRRNNNISSEKQNKMQLDWKPNDGTYLTSFW